MIDFDAAMTFASTSAGYARYTILADATWWKHTISAPEDGVTVSIVEVLFDVQDGDRRHVLDAQRVVESSIALDALASIRRGDVDAWLDATRALDRCCAANQRLRTISEVAA